MAGSAGSRGTRALRNFSVLKAWNKAEVYQKTIALFATRLAQSR
jgi:membrane-bound lytic murein transglycosylase B